MKYLQDHLFLKEKIIQLHIANRSFNKHNIFMLQIVTYANLYFSMLKKLSLGV